MAKSTSFVAGYGVICKTKCIQMGCFQVCFRHKIGRNRYCGASFYRHRPPAGAGKRIKPRAVEPEADRTSVQQSPLIGRHITHYPSLVTFLIFKERLHIHERNCPRAMRLAQNAFQTNTKVRDVRDVRDMRAFPDFPDMRDMRDVRGRSKLASGLDRCRAVKPLLHRSP